MRNWRVLTAVAAIVLAAIAGVLVWKYVDKADERAAEENGLVDALVAKAAIARGTTGEAVVSEPLYEVKQFAKKSIPAGAIEPGAEKDRAKRLSAMLGTRIAREGIPKGLPILDEQFVERSEVQGSFTEFIAKDKEAITLTVDDQHGVGGFISPGDKINMLLSLDIKDVTAKDAAPLKTTAFLLPGLKVLAVGQTTAVDAQVASTADADGDGNTTTTTAPGAAPVQRGLITVEVDARQAQQIAQAYALGGGVYLTLNPAAFDAGTFVYPEEIVEAVNLFDQNDKQPFTTLKRVQEIARLAAAANG